MKRLTTTLCLHFLLLIPASGMTVEEAYRAIPHRYTAFDAKSAKMSAKEVVYLQDFFRLVNLAIVERVQTLMWFQSNGKQGPSFQNYKIQIDKLLSQLNGLSVPKSLEGVHQQVVEAIKDQKAYFEDWQQPYAKREPFKYLLSAAGPRHRRITTSSQRLHQAYSQLMQLFPQENQQNKQAFFDHLCALDFL